MTKKSARALDILKNNGKYVYQKEFNSYTQRSQFVAKLYDCYGQHVKGYSFVTLEELKCGGLIVPVSIGDTRTEYKVPV